MRAPILSTFVTALCLMAPLSAAAQDGAPIPLTGDAAAVQEEAEVQGYVPLPPGAEGEVPPLADDTAYDDMTADDIADEAVAVVADPVPVVIDPMTACTEEAGVDHEGNPIMSRLSACLKDRHDNSEAAMETAAITAHARQKVQGKQAARSLTSSNLAFAAYRDSECVRQRSGAPDEQTALQREWACRAAMNDSRSVSLQAQ